MTYVNELVADSARKRYNSVDDLVDELFARAFETSILRTNLSSATLGKASLVTPAQSLPYPHLSVSALASHRNPARPSRHNVMALASLTTPDQFLLNHRHVAPKLGSLTSTARP